MLPAAHTCAICSSFGLIRRALYSQSQSSRGGRSRLPHTAAGGELAGGRGGPVAAVCSAEGPHDPQQEQHQRQRQQDSEKPTPVRRAPRRGPPVVGVQVTTGSSNGAQSEAVRCMSGAALLRDVMQDNLVSVDLYDKWGKVWQCGGSGRCGACRVKVLCGHELLSQRTPIEKDKLGMAIWGRNYRLACQAWVGDGENEGDIHVSID